MYTGKRTMSGVARRYRSTWRPMGDIGASAPKSNPADDLSEVRVNVQRIEEIPEIVVSAKRIPWYVWAGLGAVAVAIFTLKGKRS